MFFSSVLLLLGSIHCQIGASFIPSNNLMLENQQIAITEGPFFVMQGDGNAVLYTAGGNALWSSGTSGRGPGPFKFAVQSKNYL
jgi:hypothetical protein